MPDYTILHGDCLTCLTDFEDDSIDSIVTDPPYLIDFMGKGWDAADGIAGKPEVWAQCLRVLKPGGHLLAFGATRTYHRMTVAIEDAGFEIRDSIHYTYGSGFPKSANVGKAIAKSGDGDEAEQWNGWGTALKPSHEPIVVARKGLLGTVAQNVLAYGTGALNIDGCRVGGDGESGASAFREEGDERLPLPEGGRWPANTVLTHAAGCQAIGVTEVKSDAHWTYAKITGYGKSYGGTAEYPGPGDQPKTETVTAYDCVPGCPVTELNRQSGAGGASRFFTTTEWDPDLDDLAPFLYAKKASKRERNAGLGDGTINNHPTVKPVALLRNLARLVTPPGGVVLDPFAGSGTTGVAAILEGFAFVGIEMTDEYIPLIEARLTHAEQQAQQVER